MKLRVYQLAGGNYVRSMFMHMLCLCVLLYTFTAWQLLLVRIWIPHFFLGFCMCFPNSKEVDLLVYNTHEVCTSCT